MKKLVFVLVAVGLWGGMGIIHHAQAKPSPLAGESNNNTPIEVTSDTLEVFQEENRAVFTGHVVAIQGDVRLKADQMTVFYTQPPQGDDKENSDKKSEKQEDRRQDAVKKIEATGNGFLSTPEETASGAAGTYDVKNNMIYLNHNVVLTRGQNVLKGNHLTYNFTSGKSKLTSDFGQKAAGVKEPVPGAGKQRVRALFVPEDNQGVTKPKK